MKRHIPSALVASLFSIISAAAEPSPAGCYVTDTERALYYNCFNDYPECFSASDGTYSWLTPGNTNQTGLINMYGDTAATLITTAYNAAVAGQSYQIDGLNCASANSRLNASYNSAVLAYNYQVSLVKKLKKACGTRCKKIK